MTNDSPGNGGAPAPLRTWHGWWPLALTLSLSVVLAAIIIWGHQEDKPEVPAQPNGPPQAASTGMIRRLPMPVTDAATAMAVTDLDPAPCTVFSDRQDGVQVLRIRTHPDGDELIVNAVTGRLMAVRNMKGETITWPVSSTNGLEMPPKAS